MGAIFISYRREDSQGEAGGLSDSLAKVFGESRVFLDVEGIRAGQDFRQAIESQVTSCRVLLALIGPHWLSCCDEAGRPRLEDPQDFVRLEIASALKRDIPVIPVLIREARMVTSAQLPPDLAPLSFRQAVELSHARWDSDVAALVRSLRPEHGPDLSRLLIGSLAGAGLIGAALLASPGLRRGSAPITGTAPAAQPGTSPQTPAPTARQATPPPTPSTSGMESGGGEARGEFSLQYFPKASDPAAASEALQKLGFRFETKPASLSGNPTNAIWFGSNVPLQEVKLVAETLIQAGVAIQTIKPFSGNRPEPWASRIQVGADADYRDAPALELNSIRQARGFYR